MSLPTSFPLVSMQVVRDGHREWTVLLYWHGGVAHNYAGPYRTKRIAVKVARAWAKTIKRGLETELCHKVLNIIGNGCDEEKGGGA